MNPEAMPAGKEQLEGDQEVDEGREFNQEAIDQLNDILNSTGESCNLAYMNKNISPEDRKEIRLFMNDYTMSMAAAGTGRLTKRAQEGIVEILRK